jgi:glycerophosphoryl diester phosphodiesterase
VLPRVLDISDIRYWIANEPRFGKQAVHLDDAGVVAELPSQAELDSYMAEGINIVAPPLPIV